MRTADLPTATRVTALASLAALGWTAVCSAVTLGAVLTAKPPAAASRSATFTGRVIQARTPSYALGWNCQYQLGTRFYWRVSTKPSCPGRITIK